MTLPRTIDAVAAARRLLSPWTLALVVAGVAAGGLGGARLGERYTWRAAWTLPAIRCPGKADLALNQFSDRIHLPASLFHGRRLFDSDVPAPLADAFLHCRILEAPLAGTLRCAAEAPTSAQAEALTRTADRLLTTAGSAAALAVAELRLMATCGERYLLDLSASARQPLPAEIHAFLPQSAALAELRDPLARGAATAEPPAPGEGRPRTRTGGLSGGLAGLFAAALLAAWRSRRSDSSAGIRVRSSLSTHFAASPFASSAGASRASPEVERPSTPASTGSASARAERMPTSQWTAARAVEPGSAAARMLETIPLGERPAGTAIESGSSTLAARMLETVPLAGLLLTAGFDHLLVADLGPFTFRAAQLFALVLFLVLAVRHLRAHRGLPLPAAPALAGLLYLTIAAASTLHSLLPLKSFGYVAWAAFDLIVVAVPLLWYVRSTARLLTASRWWIAGIAINVAMGAAQIALWLSGRPAPFVWADNEGFPRINGFRFEPSYFALYVVPGAIVLLARFALEGRRGWRSGLLGGLFLVAVAASTSRSGWLGAAFGIALLLALAAWKGGRAAALRAGGLGLAALVAIGVLLAGWPTLRTHAGKLARMALDPQEHTSSKPRLEGMRQAAVVFSRHPAIGVGLGGYGAYVLAHPELPQINPVDAHGVVTTNLYLETAAETGALGLGAAMLLLASMLGPLLAWALRRQRDEAPVAAPRPALSSPGAQGEGVAPAPADARPVASALDPARAEAAPEEDADAAARVDALRLGLAAAAVTVFGVLFQFSQTLWRLDIWALLALCLASMTVPTHVPGGSRAEASARRSERR